MSRNGSGVYSLPAGNPVVTGTTISSTWANTTLSDIATALTGSVAADGQTAMTGNLQMGNNKITGLANGSASTDALAFGQIAAGTMAGSFTTLTASSTATLNTLSSSGATITGGSINGTTVGATTPNTGAFTTLSASGAFSANGGATLGDASGDALTINSSAVSIPNGLNFDSNTFVIDATNNNVGIGTSSPLAKFVVSNGTQAIEFGYSAGLSGNYIESISRPSAAGVDMNYFVTGTAVHKFFTGGTERMRIDSSGNLLVGTTTSTSGGGVLQVSNGITFPATQVASSDANTLDDYEEGTWTPSLFFSGVSGVTTYALRNGTYTKIGNTVTVRGYMSITTKSAATGSVTVEGFPFATRGASTEYHTAYIYMGGNTMTGAPMCYISGSSTNATLGQSSVGGVSFTTLTNTNFSNGGDIIFQATYLTN